MNNIRLCAFADEAGADLNVQIEALKRNSIELLEIRGVDGKNIADLTLAEAKETEKRLSDAGISVWSLGAPIGKCDIHEVRTIESERMKRVLESAVILGAQNIRIFSFYKTKPEDKDEVVDRMGEFLEIASGSGVCLSHENEKGIYGDIPERCVELQEALPELRSIFDPANFIQCGVNTTDAWEKLSKYIKYLHAKDAIDAKVVPCGMGNGNVPYIFGEFKKNGGGVITLEPHLMKFVGLSALEGGETSVVGGMSFKDANEAFDYAVNSVKNILSSL